jgi:hypothetical protein
VQISNCNVMQGTAGSYVQGALRITNSVDVEVSNLAVRGALYAGGADSATDGVVISNSAFVSLTGGLSVFWRDGISVSGGQNVTISGFQSTGNTRRGAYLFGGSQHQIVGGMYSNNGTTGGANDCGIESVNSVSDAMHTITGVQADGLGGFQDFGIVATLSGSGWTHISGNTARNNGTTDISTTDSAGNGRLMVQGNVPSVYAVPTVASAATITIPPSALVGPGTVKISGTTGITSITAAGFSGARVTLVFGAALTMTDGGNLKLNGNYTTTADDTITLVCDGTDWFEVSRSVN